MHCPWSQINGFRRTDMIMSPVPTAKITKLVATCASYMDATLILLDKKIAIFAFHEMELMLDDRHDCKVTFHGFLMCWVQAIFTIFLHTRDTKQIIFSF